MQTATQGIDLRTCRSIAPPQSERVLMGIRANWFRTPMSTWQPWPRKAGDSSRPTEAMRSCCCSGILP